ncbi:MAG: hypothetical protein Q9159_006608 [Coniocarpon cinnabarinum]
MDDALSRVLKASIPPEIRDLVKDNVNDLSNGNFFTLISSSLVKCVVGLQNDQSLDNAAYDDTEDWCDFIFRQLNILLNSQYYDLSLEQSRMYKQHSLLLAAAAALQLFVQVSVTGPPLAYSTASLLIPPSIAEDSKKLRRFRERLIASRSVDGIAAYKLTPYPELLCFADTILASPSIRKNVKVAPWVSARLLMMHQRLLSEASSTLQDQVHECLEQLPALTALLDEANRASVEIELQLERAAINLYFGNDRQARQLLNEAQQRTGLQYVLTGQLGKRTKFQEKETSQLVVLAKSQSTGEDGNHSSSNGASNGPEKIDLNDDTLLESVSFSDRATASGRIGPVAETDVPPSLRDLDPNKQPQLQPHDSVLLLLLASSITSAAPVDGLTREETLPYALRVLEGGSSNWQIYTGALLVRSRIEGHKSRTTERGLLQLQALVDQVIADTQISNNQRNGHVPSTDSATSNSHSTFLPRPLSSESAGVAERLRYVYLLNVPTRWELETELAQRWTSMGGLRSALEIYERLEMWPETALCWAACDREDKAKRIIKRQLNHSAMSRDEEAEDDETEAWEGPPRDPPPSDAPRLYCILGDLDQSPGMWERAWEISNGRYARAQRSLGRYYFMKQDAEKAAEAYAKSLKVNQLDGQTWFAYGCCLLELSRFQEAVEAFARTVQLDDHDAEAWSNLAAALVRRGPREPSTPPSTDNSIDLPSAEDDEAAIPTSHAPEIDPQQHLRDALRAFKRAATLKQDSARIYDNVLTVAASLTPPAYFDIIAAQRRIIGLRGKIDGDKCIDEQIVEALVRHVVSTYPSMPPSQRPGNYESSTANLDAAAVLETQHRPGSLPALTVDLLMERVEPLITQSASLYRTLASLYLWLEDSAASLDAHEKGWRIVTARSKWEREGDEKEWEGVVQGTLDLVDAYESLGPRSVGPSSKNERNKDVETNGDEDIVARDWKFKARSAIRGVMGRAKDLWEGSQGWERLEERLRELKGQ